MRLKSIDSLLIISISLIANYIRLFDLVQMTFISVTMDSPVLCNVRKIFSYLGFEDSKRFKSTQISCFNLFCMICNIAFVVMFHDDIIYKKDFMGTTCDMIKAVFSFLSWTCGIYTSLKNPKIHKILYDCFMQMEELSVKFYVNSQASFRKFCISFKRKFYILLTVLLFRTVIEILIMSEEQKTLNYIVSVWYGLFYCRMKQIHALFYIDLLNYYFDILNEQAESLNELLECNDRLKNVKYEKFLAERFAMCHKYFQLLHSSHEFINASYEPFLFIHQQNIFICASASLYWTIFRLFNQKEDISLFLMFVCMSYLFVLLIQSLFLTDSCEKVEDNVKILSGVIHQIKTSRGLEACTTLNDAIENLSLEILRNDFTIKYYIYSASGFFDINYRLFAKVGLSKFNFKFKFD